MTDLDHRVVDALGVIINKIQRDGLDHPGSLVQHLPLMDRDGELIVTVHVHEHLNQLQVPRKVGFDGRV